MIRRRIRNIIKRMSEGDAYYKEFSPFITQKEINGISEIFDGSVLQIEKLYGAETGSPTIVYPLHKEKFIQQAKELEII